MIAGRVETMLKRERNTEPRNMLPTWAPRVTQREIRRLYEMDAKGINDEELINEVGYGLLARCLSSIDAAEAVRGKARCPQCSRVVTHTGRREELLLDPKELELVYRLRRVLSELNPVEAVELLKSRLAKCRTNAEFLMTMNLD